MPSPPIRLLPSALPAGAASLTIHSALLILVFANSGRWRSVQTASSVMLQTNVLVLTYGLAPQERMPAVGTDDRGPGRTELVTRSARAEDRVLAGELSPLEPADLIPTIATALAIRAAPPRLVAMPSITLTPGAGGPDGYAARTSGPGFGPGPSDRSGRGIAKVAELIGKSGDACPVLRLLRRAGTVAVAVTFVVDTSGVVDRATLRVVQRPGEPPEPTGFIPHIYAVGASVRVDRSLDDVRAAYGTIVAGDVLRHVAALRFRPALRNGLPVRSTVLIACQTG